MLTVAKPRTPPRPLTKRTPPPVCEGWAVDWLAERLQPDEVAKMLAEVSARRLGAKPSEVFGMFLVPGRPCTWRSALYLDTSALLDLRDRGLCYAVRLLRAGYDGPDTILADDLLNRDEADALAATARGLGITVRRATRAHSFDGDKQ